jgi:probable HAF family extracellular repeat protein
MNDRGQIIGNWGPTPRAMWPVYAFLYNRSTGMQDLGTLVADASLKVITPTAINNRGQVVGEWDSSSQSGWKNRAFLWTKDEGMQDLGDLSGGASSAQAISNSGQVVGGSTIASGSTHAFLWKKGNGMRDLGTLGGDTSWALAINDDGQVVGGSTTASGSYQAFLWTKTGAMQDLSSGQVIGYSEARAINSSGQVIGYSDRGPFFWSESSGIQDLLRPSQAGWAQAINALGQVVGYYSGPQSQKRAFLWTLAGGLQDLGTLELTPGGGTYASDINSTGQVVGTSNRRPFLWTAAEGMKDLTSLVVNLPERAATSINFTAITINDNAWISGSWEDNGPGRPYTNYPDYKAYLLIPIE